MTNHAPTPAGPARRRPRGFGRWLWLLAPCVVALAAAAADALTPAELVTPELTAQPVTLTGMQDEDLAFFDDERRLRREPVDGFVRLRLEPGRAAEAAPPAGAVLALTDGQRLAGEWAGTEDAGQTLVWRHPLLGELRVSLDAIRSVRFVTLQEAPPPAGQDQVVLSNGDALHGFVPTLGGPGEGVTIEHQGQPVVIPRERVRAIVLGNPLADPPAIAGRHLVRFRDGTRLLASDLSIARDRLRLLPQVSTPRAVIDLTLRDVESIDFLGGGWQLLDLADQPMQVLAGGDVFGLPVPPRWERGVLRLHAPVTIGFTLPAEATRVAAVAELDLDDAPSHLRGWSGLTIRFGAAEPVALVARAPVARLSATAGSAAFEITLDEAVNGPILDRLALRHAVVLVRRAITEATGGTATQPPDAPAAADLPDAP